MSNNDLAKEIVEKIVAEVNGSVTLSYNIEAALQDAIMKSVLVHAKRIIREECTTEGVDTGELSKALKISSESQADWEREIVKKLAIKVCEELRKIIEIRLISGSYIPESITKSPKCELLLG